MQQIVFVEADEPETHLGRVRFSVVSFGKEDTFAALPVVVKRLRAVFKYPRHELT